MNNSLISSNRNQLQDLIGGAQSIGIIVGENQNIDAMGAALGLYLSLINSGKSVQIVSKKAPVVELSNLFGINRVAKSFSGQIKVLTISVPYREGEIEKVSYNIEQDKLNVNLFAEENGINFSENEVEYIRKGASPSLIIAVGVTDESEIAALVDLKAVKLITIDKSPLNSIQGDVNLVDPNFSSVSEIVASLIRDLGFAGEADAFQNLMDGVTYATRNFTNPATSALAFEMAGFLLSNGAKRKDVAINENKQNRPDNRFPDSNQFLNRRPRFNKGQGQPQQQGRQGQNQGGQQASQIRPGGQNQPQNRQGFQSPISNQNRQSNENRRSNDIHNQEDIKTQAPDVEPITNDFIAQMPSPAPSMQNPTIPQNDIMDAASIVDDSVKNDDIPDDWFLPKVFKSSKKGPQN